MLNSVAVVDFEGKKKQPRPFSVLETPTRGGQPFPPLTKVLPLLLVDRRGIGVNKSSTTISGRKK